MTKDKITIEDLAVMMQKQFESIEARFDRVDRDIFSLRVEHSQTRLDLSIVKKDVSATKEKVDKIDKKLSEDVKAAMKDDIRQDKEKKLIKVRLKTAGIA